MGCAASGGGGGGGGDSASADGAESSPRGSPRERGDAEVSRLNVKANLEKKNSFLAVQETREAVEASKARPGGGLTVALNRALLQLFECLDTNGDGKLSSQEITQFLSSLDAHFKNLSKAQQHARLKVFVSDFDDDGDGEISVQEWRDKAARDFAPAPSPAGLPGEISQEDVEDNLETQQEALEYTKNLLARLKGDHG